VQNEKCLLIVFVRSDHGWKFQNENLCELFESFGITHNFSISRTLEQNSVVKRKNRALQEMLTPHLNTFKQK